MIEITYPNHDKHKFESGITTFDIAVSISKSLSKKAIGGIVNGENYDLNRPILNDASIEVVTAEHKAAFHFLNHSAAHLMAQAIQNLHPTTKFGIGPAIDEGFYYDIDLAVNLTNEDLLLIEKEMYRITTEQNEIIRENVTFEEAKVIFADDEYKLELIIELNNKGESLTVYRQGNFVDLCRGGHVGNTKNIKFFKLLSLAGAY